VYKRQDGLWGYVSTTGSVSIDLQFSDAKSFSNGFAAVETFEGWVYIDISGSVAIRPGFQVASAGDFSDRLAPLQPSSGWGYIDANGTPIINPNFSQAGPFTDGLAWVMEDDYIGFIDNSGELQIPYQFAEVRPFSQDLAAVRLSSNWYYIQKRTGTIAFNQPFDEAQSFVNGVARVRLGEDQNARYGYINRCGEYVWFPTR